MTEEGTSGGGVEGWLGRGCLPDEKGGAGASSAFNHRLTFWYCTFLRLICLPHFHDDGSDDGGQFTVKGTAGRPTRDCDSVKQNMEPQGPLRMRWGGIVVVGGLTLQLPGQDALVGVDIVQ